MPLYPPHSDEELVQLLQNNNEQAFNQIYQRYWRKLYAMAYHRLRSKQASEDVVQEVLAGVWQRRNTTAIQNLEAYLATATRFAVFRQLSREATLSSTDTTHNEPVTQGTPDERLLLQQLQKEINRLPEKCRLVFQYSRDLGMTNREIADELDISQKAVEKHITKAIKSLRDHLKSFSAPPFNFFSKVR